jgi:hypothetical protein
MTGSVVRAAYDLNVDPGRLAVVMATVKQGFGLEVPAEYPSDVTREDFAGASNSIS